MTVSELLQFVEGGPGEPTKEQAQQSLDIAGAVVDGYCRGGARNGAGEWRAGIGAIVLAVAARVLANPSGVQYRDQAGPFSVSRQSSFTGFTLAELAVLGRYRRTAV